LELDGFIKKLQVRINSPSLVSIKIPDIIPIKKEESKDCYECRPISLYQLEERIIISQTAKELWKLFSIMNTVEVSENL
jgi:hypothetical protein